MCMIDVHWWKADMLRSQLVELVEEKYYILTRNYPILYSSTGSTKAFQTRLAACPSHGQFHTFNPFISLFY